MRSNSMRYIAIFLATLVALVAPATADDADGADRVPALIAEAHELLAAGEMSQAVTKLETVDRLTNGQSVDALLLLAIVHNNIGKPEAAIDFAEKALELDLPPVQTADAHFQLGLAHLTRAAPEGGGSWSRRDLRRAETALRKAVQLEGPRVIEAKAHLGYVLVLRENQKSTPSKEGYDEGFALARERYEDGSPGSGMAIARHVLCGSPTCEPYEAPKESTVPLSSSSDGDDSEKGPVLRPKKVTPDSVPGMTYAQRNGIRGKIVAQATITVEGRLADIRILQGLPFGMNEMVVEDLRHWRFEPATQDGEPVAIMYNAIFNYP